MSDKSLSAQASMPGLLGGEPNVGKLDLYGKAIREIPDAGAELFAEVRQHPGATGLHVGVDAVKAIGTGLIIGYAVPAKGPAAALLTAFYVGSTAWDAVARLAKASTELETEKSDAVAKSLAKDFVSGVGDFSLGLAGGYFGAAGGIKVARSNGFLGRAAEGSQRSVAKVENEALLFTQSKLEKLNGQSTLRMDVNGGTPNGPDGIAPANRALERGFGTETADATINAPASTFLKLPTSGLRNRVQQYSLASQPLVEPAAAAAAEPEMQLFYGSTHGHSRYSDGMGLPIDLYKKAIAEGQQVTTITDHNHLAARNGVKPDDPRAKDQAGTPIIAANPIEYSQTILDAANTTIPGKHVSLYGIEMGTIGGPKHTHDGRPHGGHEDGAGETETGGDDGHKHGGGRKPKATEEGAVDQGTDKKGATPKLVLDHPEEVTPATVTPPVETTLKLDVTDHPEQPGSPVIESLTTRATGMIPKDGGTPDVHVTYSDTGERLTPYDFKAAQLESLEAAHLGGVNHFNVIDSPTFFEATRTPRKGLMGAIAHFTGMIPKEVVVEPDIFKYNDGNLKPMIVSHFSNLRDSSGNKLTVSFNHPRIAADSNKSLPLSEQGRDYGRKSFDNDDDWLKTFVKPHVRGIELIKGGAMKEDPVDTVKPGDIDLRSFTGYLGLGVEAGPLFGRDFHFGDPVGNPGSTGFLARTLDKPSILESLRERRFMATTDKVRLNGVMTANDKFPMGSILDQNAVPDIQLKMKIGGQIEPDASYTVKLYGDEQVLDGTDAAVIQTKQLTGQELLAANGQVAFAPIHHKLGNNSLYFTEVARKDSADNTTKMWTSPIWVQPVGDNHGVVARLSAGGLGQQWIPGLPPGIVGNTK